VWVRRNHSSVVRGVSFDLTSGIVAIAGPNGSGKSTLLRAIATILPLAEGHIEVMGVDVGTRHGRTLARRNLGFLPQGPAYLEHLLVIEALEYAAWLHGIGRPARAVVVRQAIEEFDLGEVAATRLGDLSGGTRQRAYVAQVFIHRPPVLLLDEPTVGVDAEHRVELRRVIARLAAERLIVLSTHLTEDIEFLAHEVVVLSAGRTVFRGTSAALAELGRQSHASDERPVERALRELGLSPT